MTRQINNVSGIAKFIDDIGVSIPAGIYTIPPERYWYFASSISIDTFINNGQFVIIHNGVALNVYDAMWLIHEATDYLITERDTPSVAIVTRQTKTIRFKGPVFTVTNPSSGRTDVSVQLSGTAEGKEATYQYFRNGNINDSWFDHEGGTISSLGTPGVMYASCKIRSITFSNDQDNSNINIELYKNGIAPGNLLYSWQIRDKRIAWKTNNLETLTFNTGDTLRLFGNTSVAAGTKPRSVVIKITVINLNDILGEGGFSTVP